MNWTNEDIVKFIEQVAAPNENLQGFDDRTLYDDAIKIAQEQGAAGKKLLEALEKMK